MDNMLYKVEYLVTDVVIHLNFELQVSKFNSANITYIKALQLHYITAVETASVIRFFKC